MTGPVAWLVRLLFLALCGGIASCGGGTSESTPGSDGNAQKPSISAVGQSSDPSSPLMVTEISSLSSTRVSRTEYEYSYSVTVKNYSTQDLKAVTATLLSVGSGTTIVQGIITFGDINANGSAIGKGVLIIQQDRTISFDRSGWLWKLSTFDPGQAPGAFVEYLSTVITPAGFEARKYSFDPANRKLTYSGVAPPPAGSVVVLEGSAYKVGVQTLQADGTIVFDTSTPDFQEVFETLIISTDISLVPTTQSGRVRPLDLGLPVISISTAFDTIPAEITGSLSKGLATVRFNYSHRTGINFSQLSVSGTLTASAALRVAANVKGKYVVPFPTVVNIPIPATLGTISFKMPVRVFASVESPSLELQIAQWEKTYDFVAGATYNTTLQKWENISSFTDVTSIDAPVAASSLSEKLISAFGAVNIASKITAATVTIGPQISPQISALNDTVGVIGVRHEFGLQAAVELKGSFPSLIECASIPLSITQNVYAYLNHLSFESLLDFEGAVETLEYRILNAELLLKEYPFGKCGPPMLTVSPSTQSVQVGQSVGFAIAATDAEGNTIPVPAGLQWASSNPLVATVDSTGTVTGIKAGTSQISATDLNSGAKASATVTVVESGNGHSYYFVFQNFECGTSGTASFTVTGGNQTVTEQASISVPACTPNGPRYDNISYGPLPITLQKGVNYTVTFDWSGNGGPLSNTAYEIFSVNSAGQFVKLLAAYQSFNQAAVGSNVKSFVSD